MAQGRGARGSHSATVHAAAAQLPCTEHQTHNAFDFGASAHTAVSEAQPCAAQVCQSGVSVHVQAHTEAVCVLCVCVWVCARARGCAHLWHDIGDTASDAALV